MTTVPPTAARLSTETPVSNPAWCAAFTGCCKHRKYNTFTKTHTNKKNTGVVIAGKITKNQEIFFLKITFFKKSASVTLQLKEIVRLHFAQVQL